MTDGEHHIARVVAPPRFVPKRELFGKIGGGLSGKWRIGCAHTLSPLAVARRARQETTRSVSFVIKRRSCLDDSAAACFERQSGIVRSDRLTFHCTKPFRYPAHLRMVAAAIGIGFELPLQIACVQPRQPGRPGTVTAPIKTMASETSVIRAGRRATHRDDATIFGKAVKRGCFSRAAPGKDRYGDEWEQDVHVGTTAQVTRLFRLAAVATLLPIAACKPPPDDRQSMPVASAANGLRVIERVGCGICHIIPGIDWPQGKVGPNLAGLTDRALIAGKLPNRPDILAAYIRNAPALVPGSGMPAMPVTDAESRDIAAYLYQKEDR